MRNLDEVIESMRDATPEEVEVVRDYMMQTSTPLAAAAYSVTIVYKDETVVYLFKTLGDAIGFLEYNFHMKLNDHKDEIVDYDISEDRMRACIEMFDETYMIFVGQVFT